jgi:hypothetical protein
MLRQHNGLQKNKKGETNMKTYYFWVTLKGKGPMKVAESGRTSFEAKSIVESRFPGATVMLAEGF